jgi:hypothetical protein
VISPESHVGEVPAWLSAHRASREWGLLWSVLTALMRSSHDYTSKE